MDEEQRRSARAGRRATSYWLLGALMIVLLAGTGVGLSWQAGTRNAPRSSDASTVPARRETRPTLDPARFVGKAALTHQIARDIPDVLDRLYCYCECDKHVGHKSLLSCYTDGHAAT